jgi:tetratricopeptide (TPR) repeat protein
MQIIGNRMKKIVFSIIIAIASLNLVVASNGDKARKYYNKGCYLLSTHDLSGALMQLNSAIELDPHNANFWDKRGTVYFEMRNYASAISDYTKAISLAPSIGFYYTERALAYQGLGNVNAMFKDLVIAADLGEPEAQKIVAAHIARINAANNSYRANIKKDIQADIEKRFGFKPGTICW